MTLTMIPVAWYDTETVIARTEVGDFKGLLTGGEEGTESVKVGEWTIDVNSIIAMEVIPAPVTGSVTGNGMLLLLIGAGLLLMSGAFSNKGKWCW